MCYVPSKLASLFLCLLFSVELIISVEMEQRILLHWKSPLLCVALVSNMDVTMSAYDF